MRPVVRPDFVVADSAAPDLDELLAAIRSALSSGFTVTRITGRRRVSRVWLDTFDWRLYRAGLTLEYADGELRASDGTTQPTPGWRVPVRGAIKPPPGPVADKIARLIAPRELVRAAHVTTTTVGLTLLNSDAKTVARLEVDWPQNARPRITITAIRGYPAQARRAQALLAEALPGLAAQDQDPIHEAADRTPGAYTGKVDAPITPDQPAQAATAKVLLNLLDTLEANVDGVLRDIDTEFLHDLRVAVRRTRSALKLLRTRLSLPDLPHFTAEFKWLGEVTTPVRDLDVHLLEFDETAKRLDAGHPLDLAPVREYLVRRRATEFRRLTRQLRSDRFASLTATWRKALTELETPRRRGPDAQTVAVATTRGAWRKLLTKGRAITETSAPEKLHDLRKRAKELRYALEFFAPVYPADQYSAVLSDLKKLQDCLGEYQDTHVQIEEIRQQAEDLLADREHPVQAGTLLAMGELIAGLAARQRAAREDFARRFAAFAGPAGTRRFTRLLGDDE
jgi:CHAD domain-containing protein